MVRFLAKLYVRRYVILAVVAAIVLTCVLWPSKKETDSDIQLNATEPMETNEAVVTNTYMYVSDITALYSQPNVESEQISTLQVGTQVEKTKNINEEWCAVKYQDGEAFIMSDSLVYEYTPEETTIPTEPKFEPYMSDDGKWLNVQEEVRTEGNVWLRKTPGGEKLELITEGKRLQRSQIGVNGWSKVESDNQEGYVSTFYLYPSDGVTYEECEEFVIVTEDARVRSSGSIKSDQQGWVIKGDTYVRVGTSQHGWSQILYKGKVQYVFSQYITKIEKEVTEKDLGSYVAPSKRANSN